MAGGFLRWRVGKNGAEKIGLLLDRVSYSIV
jgi:hypothetical protein